MNLTNCVPGCGPFDLENLIMTPLSFLLHISHPHTLLSPLSFMSPLGPDDQQAGLILHRYFPFVQRRVYRLFPVYIGSLDLPPIRPEQGFPVYPPV
jgi:hypothetical protein